MLVCGYVFTVKFVHVLCKCLHECFLHVLVDEDVVRSDAGLAAVECLSPGDSLGSEVDVCCLVDDAGALSAEFQDYRCEILGSGCHYGLCKCRASCEEDDVPSLFEQCGIDFSVSLDYSDVLLLEGVSDHLLDDF